MREYIRRPPHRRSHSHEEKEHQDAQYHFHEPRMDVVPLRSIDRMAFPRVRQWQTCGVRGDACRDYEGEYDAF